MGKYSDDPEWADVIPIPQDEGGPNPLAAIAYTDAYAEAMSYLRAIMGANEMSDRALALTGDIISMNAAHYTVWLYRAAILRANPHDLSAELSWLNTTALSHQKNYQIWHHRQLVLSLLYPSPSSSSLPPTPTSNNGPTSDKALPSTEEETSFIAQMLSQDSKNYHVWSYRQWLVRRFSLWTDAEVAWTTTMIDEDVRNNSAWNHRFFVVCGESGMVLKEDKQVREREVGFAKEKIRLAPQNQSPWNYLRGVLEKGGGGVEEIEGFCREFAVGVGGEQNGEGEEEEEEEEEEKVSSSHALDMLAEIWARRGSKGEAGRAYELLASRYDPIRANYWAYLRGRLDGGGNVAAA